MPTRHHHIAGRTRVRRLRTSTRIWIVIGIVVAGFFLALYYDSIITTGELESNPNSELGY